MLRLLIKNKYEDVIFQYSKTGVTRTELCIVTPIFEGEKTKVWYDACTGKQVRYGVAIARRLRLLGHEVMLTTRKHPDTVALANLLGESFVIVGKYDPTSLLSRLKESTKRQLLFCNMFEEGVPDLAISHHPIEICRVAFGLGIPHIVTHDTPHAEAANRLTLPLVDFLVVSKALPKHAVEGFGIKKIFRFDGVDEVAWIKGFKPGVKHDYGRPLIMIREIETKAAYAQGRENLTRTLAKKLASMGNVLFLPRYGKPPEKGLTVPKEFVDSASLVSQADLVISAGGTLARESCLQGIPTIVVPSFERIHVNDYLFKKGFPIFTITSDKILDYAKRLLGKKRDVGNLLDSLENPLDTMERVIREEICL
jgi:predicted glycosyltransferase